MGNLTVREGDGNLSQLFAEGEGTTEDPKITGSVAHAHRSSGYIHFHQETLEAPLTESWILLDLSDTTNYPHSDTEKGHIDWLAVAIDPLVNSAWKVNLWLLSDVTVSDCTKTMIWSRSGTKSTGNVLDVFERMHPYGPVLDNANIVSSMVETGYAGYNSATNMKTVYSPGSAVIPPGNGDLILELILTGDDIGLQVNSGYHTHSADHPTF